MRILFFFILTILCSLPALPQQAARVECDRNVYTQWSRLSSKQLMSMANHWRRIVNRPDSALICYTIVANRYYGKEQSNDDVKRSIEALNSIGLLYLDDFYDFPKSYSYLLQAKELARKHHYDYFIPSIEMSMLIVEGYRSSFASNKLDLNLVRQYKKSFRKALKQKNWYALQNLFFDLALHCTFHGNDTIFNQEKRVIRNLSLPDTTAWLQYARLLCDGIDAYLQHDRQQSFSYFRQMLGCASRINPGARPTARIIARNYMYLWHLDTAKVDEAIKGVLTNEKEAKEHNLMVHLQDAYFNLQELNKIKGNQRLADKYYILYLETKDNINNSKRLANIGEAGLLFEMQKKHEEAKRLAYEREMQLRIIVGIVVFSVILLFMLGWLYRKYRQVSLQKRSLYDRTQEIIKAQAEKRQLASQVKSETSRPKYESSSLSTVDKQSLFHHIMLVMETAPEVFEPSFTLEKLSQLVDARANNVSQVINENCDGGFYSMLNEHRINEACRRMNDRERYGQFTIEAIAQGVGFKSRSNFSRTFKAVTGLTPSAYQKMSRK